MSWTKWAEERLAQIRAEHRWREASAFDPSAILSFASNDYLGLATHPVVIAAAVAAAEEFGTGATASRLVVGTRRIHDELEAALANWQGAERALAFPSGYQANLAALTVFGGEDVTIFSDELNHASIIDGCRLAKAQTIVYRHNDMDQLCTLLQQHSGRKLVVSDLVFSMDGDLAPIDELTRLCADHNALLILDEAHAVLQKPQPLNCQVLRVGTLSKTLGAQGGWIAGSQALIELLTNRARTFVFTTALAPTSTAAALAALHVFASLEGVALREQLRALVDLFDPTHPAPIIPHILGEERAALHASAYLRERGVHIPAIRPPTVPPGTSRLRIALSARHTREQVLNLQRLLREFSFPTRALA